MRAELTTPRLDRNRTVNRRPETVEHHTPTGPNRGGRTIAYLHSDNVGSVRTITSSTGAVAGATDYGPYGAVTARLGAGTSSFGYATAWTDPTTTLDYLRARDYDPTTAQFVQVDPDVDQTRMPYEYVAGDPLKLTDPTGLCGQGDSVCNFFQYAGFVVAGLGDEVHDSVCGSTDGFSCAVQKLDPIYGLIAGIDECTRSSDPATCANQKLNPVYRAIDAYGREVSDAENGCDWTVVAQDGLDAVSGVADTVAVAALPESAGNGGIDLGGYRSGREVSVGKDARVSAGNKNGVGNDQLPHYHRRGVDRNGATLPGQGIGRHRPWDTKSTDKSFWDRF